MAAVGDGRLGALWIGPRKGPLGIEAAELCRDRPHEIEKLMIDGLIAGPVGDFRLDGLRFDRANVMEKWPKIVPIERQSRGLAREVYARLDGGVSPDDIRQQFPGVDDGFIERVRGDAVIGGELAAYSANQAQQHLAEKEARATLRLPAPSERRPLPSERVTLCEAITWIGTGKARKRHLMRKHANRRGGDLPLKAKVAFEQAQHELMTALREERLPLFGHRRERGSDDVDDSMEKVPVEWLMEPVYFVPLDDEIVSLSGSAYVAGTLRRSDLIQTWGADPAQTSAAQGRVYDPEEATGQGRYESWEDEIEQRGKRPIREVAQVIAKREEVDPNTVEREARRVRREREKSGNQKKSAPHLTH